MAQPTTVTYRQFADSLSDNDFIGMLFNVAKQPLSYKYCEVFPELQKYPEFTRPLKNATDPTIGQRRTDDRQTRAIDKSDIFRYICYVYDIRSPFHKIEDLNNKKIYAAKYAGFVMEGYEFPFQVQAILACKHEFANKMIVRFLRIQSNDEFAHLCFLREKYFQLHDKFMSPDEDIKKSELEMMNTMQAEMVSIKLKVSMGDTALSTNMFKYFNEMESLPTPEYIAEQFTKDNDFAPKTENEY